MAQRVYEQALELSDEEHEQFIEALARSLKPVELSPAWQAEIVRTLQSIERGEAVSHPHISRKRISSRRNGSGTSIDDVPTIIAFRAS
jgi:predicted transcriptional regulator